MIRLVALLVIVGFVDTTSYAVMRRLELTGALAFDGDCAAA